MTAELFWESKLIGLGSGEWIAVRIFKIDRFFLFDAGAIPEKGEEHPKSKQLIVVDRQVKDKRTGTIRVVYSNIEP